MLWTIMIPAFASVDLKPEERYGMPVKFQTNQAYPGAIKIDGVLFIKMQKNTYLLFCTVTANWPNWIIKVLRQ
jgi:hypothetical protein